MMENERLGTYRIHGAWAAEYSEAHAAGPAGAVTMAYRTWKVWAEKAAYLNTAIRNLQGSGRVSQVVWKDDVLYATFDNHTAPADVEELVAVPLHSMMPHGVDDLTWFIDRGWSVWNRPPTQ